MGVVYTESQPRSLSCIKGKPEVEVVFAFTFLFKWLPSQIHPVPLIKQNSCFPYPVQDDKASPSPKQSLGARTGSHLPSPELVPVLFESGKHVLR